MPGPLAWGGLLLPLLWTAVSYGLMGVVNPLLQQRVDWPWFIVSQFVFGVVAAIVVVRSEMVYIPPAGPGRTPGEFVAGSGGDNDRCRAEVAWRRDCGRRVRGIGLVPAPGLPRWLLASCGLRPLGPTQAADRPVPADQVVDFATLYEQNCAGCHGADGKLGPAPPLNDPLFLAIVPDDGLLGVISEGRPGRRCRPLPRTRAGR